MKAMLLVIVLVLIAGCAESHQRVGDGGCQRCHDGWLGGMRDR